MVPGKLVLRRRSLPTSSGVLRVPLQYTRKRNPPPQPEAVLPEDPIKPNLGALFPRIRNDELGMEKEEMQLDEALDKVNRTFAPSRIFVWVVEISVLVIFTYATFTALGSIIRSHLVMQSPGAWKQSGGSGSRRRIGRPGWCRRRSSR